MWWLREKKMAKPIFQRYLKEIIKKMEENDWRFLIVCSGERAPKLSGQWVVILIQCTHSSDCYFCYILVFIHLLSLIERWKNVLVY